MAHNTQELLNLGLPKWPKMYVTGAPVGVVRAKEIIRRTDAFFVTGHGGNNRDYNQWVREMVGIPVPFWERPGWLLPSDGATQEQKDAATESRRAALEADCQELQSFERRWQVIATNYVHNDWISCAFVYGPRGWCHPDGNIGFVDNVGKWPSIKDVLDDWVKIAEAFQFLDVGVTLYDRGSCEPGLLPVVSLSVKAGCVQLVDPALVNVHAGHAQAERRAGSESASGGPFDFSRENGIPCEWIEEWANSAAGKPGEQA